ncbi:MAG TPA: hypothetical protein VHV09_17225 [Trebonia sp.]|nr:hypothetical protein [Trebonia sp.]
MSGPGLRRRQLERRPAGRLTDSADDEPKLSAIARAQAAGRVRPGAPAREHQRRRALLRESVARAVAP